MRIHKGVFSLTVIGLIAIFLLGACSGNDQDETSSPTAPTRATSSPTTNSSTNSALEKPIRLVYSDVEAFPIQMGNGETVADPPGIVVEILIQAAAELGLEVEFERRPNERVLTELQDGSADGAFSYSFKEERLQNGLYPLDGDKLDANRRIITISYYVYKMSDSPLDWDGNEFINLTGAIGANSGYSIAGDLRNSGVEVEEAKTTEQNLIKLQQGRIAGYASQDITVDRLIESGQYGDVVRVSIPLATKDYFLMFSHQFMAQHPEIAEQLWTKIGELRDSVTEEALSKYQTPTEQG